MIEKVTGQQPELNSTVPTGHFVCPGQNITLTCVTRRSPVVSWRSNEYIGQNRTLMLASHNPKEHSQQSGTIAVLTRMNSTTGSEVMQLESKLYLNVSPKFKKFTVSCLTADFRNTTATFYLLGKLSCHQKLLL